MTSTDILFGKDKFYPDFIAKTKSGKYILLEYKGEHIATGEDSDYKKAIGEQWKKLSGELGGYFEENKKAEILNMIELKNTAERRSLAVPGYSLDSRDRADPPSTKVSIAYSK